MPVHKISPQNKHLAAEHVVRRSADVLRYCETRLTSTVTGTEPEYILRQRCVRTNGVWGRTVVRVDRVTARANKNRSVRTCTRAG